MTSSRNYSELKEAWIKWRNVSGRLMKEDYANFVDLSNKAVRELGEYFKLHKHALAIYLDFFHL